MFDPAQISSTDQAYVWLNDPNDNNQHHNL